ncbi:MAG: hypothetical protein ACI4G1_05305 [Ruminococcus sp.]
MENKLKTVDAETLLSTPMSKTMFIVDNLIPQGVNVISGASKIGKSWLMLWLGHAGERRSKEASELFVFTRKRETRNLRRRGAGNARLGTDDTAMRCVVFKP